MSEEQSIRLGGMALANGVLVHGPRHWSCAVRTEDGGLRVLPNGQITEFASYGVGGMPASVEVPIAREAPVGEALAALAEVGEAWARETGAALDRSLVPGIMGFSGGAAP